MIVSQEQHLLPSHHILLAVTVQQETGAEGVRVVCGDVRLWSSKLNIEEERTKCKAALTEVYSLAEGKYFHEVVECRS